MIYMVEMALPDLARRAEWDAWYVAHQHRLLSIPGFRASQRFEAVHAAASPFVALHEVDASDVFVSPPYRANAGPSNTGEWQAKMDNWHRNLFTGIDHTPEVAMDLGHTSVQWMDAVGLDRSVKRRGLAVLPPATADRFAGTARVRVLQPIGPRLRPDG